MVDIPCLQSDRCHKSTTDTREMGSLYRLSSYDVGGITNWDLCPDCRRLLVEIIGEIIGEKSPEAKERKR